jgi:hypothetical protein
MGVDHLLVAFASPVWAGSWGQGAGRRMGVIFQNKWDEREGYFS